jgi:hypothetical protein
MSSNNDEQGRSDYLLLSRGQWDADLPLSEIEAAIERFYRWYEAGLQSGTMKPGQRLAPEGRFVSRRGITDGPYAEAKEVVGGYWFIVADSLDAAAAIAAGNPCLACGLHFEIRPVDPQRASAYVPASETPPRR